MASQEYHQGTPTVNKKFIPNAVKILRLLAVAFTQNKKLGGSYHNRSAVMEITFISMVKNYIQNFVPSEKKCYKKLNFMEFCLKKISETSIAVHLINPLVKFIMLSV